MILKHVPEKKIFSRLLQPAQAWFAILVFIVFSILCILVGAGKILNVAFPTSAFLLGLLLYIRFPILYIGFIWWLFFLSPFVRRLADYRSGFTDSSPILLSPYLVILIALITVWRHLPNTYRQGGFPFLLSLSAVVYGYLIGLVQGSPISVTKSFLEWFAPILLGFHIFLKWQYYSDFCKNIRQVFTWGVFVTGIYGVLQYVIAPEWDRFWLKSVAMSSAGSPEPFKIRVWSTMNGPGAFAIFMMAGLLLLFSNRGTLYIPASVAGYLAFLLSAVRAAWGGWFIGLIILTLSLRSNDKIRLIFTIILISLIVIPLTNIGHFHDLIYSRLETFSDIENDGSGVVRRQTYEYWLGYALNSFTGMGIGNTPGFDSAILTLLLELGWFGTIFYMGGIFLLISAFYQNSWMRRDLFVSTANAIIFGILFQLAFGPAMLGVGGVILWSFLGMNLAAQKFYRNQIQT